MSNRRTDLRRGSIDLSQLVSDPDSMINDEGKLSIPQGSMTDDQLAVLEKLVIAMQSTNDVTWSNLRSLVTSLKTDRVPYPPDTVLLGELNVLTKTSDAGYELQLGSQTKPLFNIVTNTIRVLEEDSIYLAGLKLSVVDGNIVVKNEQDQILAVLNDLVAEENIKTAILADDTDDGLIQQVIDRVPTGLNGKSALELWQESQNNSELTLDDFLAYLEGDQGPAGADGLSIRFVGRTVTVYQEVISDTPLTPEEEVQVYLAGTNPPTLHNPVAGDLVINPNSELLYFDGTSWNNYGSIKGDDGADGQPGPAGQDADSDEIATTLATSPIFRSSLAQDLVTDYVDELKGPPGNDGQRGEDGQPGLQGPAGVPLDILTAQSNNELPGDSPEGTLAIVQLHEGGPQLNTIYKKTSTGWEYQNQSLKGEKGDQGDDGEDGNQGPVGPQGEPGQDGETPIAKTFVVTAVDGQYYIDGVQAPSLTLFRGQTYVFDYSNVPELHPFQIQTASDTSVDEGLSIDNNVATYKVPANLNENLKYICTNHSNMGNSIEIYNLIPSELKGADGQNGIDGVSPTAAEVSADLIDNHIDVIKGPKGDDGDDGQQGDPGVGIDTVTLVDDNLVISLTDNTDLPALGPIRGPQGLPGANGLDGTAIRYLLKVEYEASGVPKLGGASFIETLSQFEHSGAEVDLYIVDDQEGSPHTVSLKFTEESSPPISTLVYGYNAENNTYKVFNHHDSNLMNIIPANYTNHEDLFNSYDNNDTSLSLIINTSSTKAKTVKSFTDPVESHAFIIFSF